MSGEPKTRVMTLEEAVEALYSYGMELRAESLTGEGVSWSVFEFSTELGRPVLVCNGHGTWWEAVSDALGVPVVARDEAAELREENKRLSALVDELLLAPNPLDDENMRLRDETAELRAALGATVDAINGALIYHHHSLGNPVKKELNEAVNRAGRALAEGEKP